MDNIKKNPRKIYFHNGRIMAVAVAFQGRAVEISDCAAEILDPLPKPSSYKYSV